MAPGWERPLFRDRADAGRRLAQALMRYKDENPVVLALPRGGVPVAFEVATVLGAPLDLVLARKVGAPFQPELAVAAVADGETPVTVVNPQILQTGLIPERYLEEESGRQLAEIERRRRVYLGERKPVPVEGRTAIVIDDGIATGATTRAALRSVRKAGPRHLVLAVPVAPPDAVANLRNEADEVVCLATPSGFGAIGMFYEDFAQLSDAEVIDLMKRAPQP